MDLCSVRAERGFQAFDSYIFPQKQEGGNRHTVSTPKSATAVLELLDYKIYVPVSQVGQASLVLPVSPVLLQPEESAVRTNNNFQSKTARRSSPRTLEGRFAGTRPQLDNTLGVHSGTPNKLTFQNSSGNKMLKNNKLSPFNLSWGYFSCSALPGEIQSSISQQDLSKLLSQQQQNHRFTYLNLNRAWHHGQIQTLLILHFILPLRVKAD